MLVYDITNMKSFEHLQEVWIRDLKLNLQDAQLILVGNKTDLADDGENRQVTREEALDLIKRHRLKHYVEVSAKEGTGITGLVNYLSEELFKKYEAELNDFKESDYASMSDVTPIIPRR